MKREILRRICGGPLFNTETGQYERRMNVDNERTINLPNDQKFLVSKILEWVDKDSTMRQVLSAKPNKTRSRGRPRQRWLDRVKKYLYQVDETASIEEAGNRRIEKLS